MHINVTEPRMLYIFRLISRLTMYGMSWSLVLALGVSTSLAMYAGTELTSYIFKKEVMKSESVWIDEVYVTWC